MFETVDNSVIADVLERAADVLEGRPWGQGGVRKERGEMCLVDAIREAAGIEDYFQGSMDAFIHGHEAVKAMHRFLRATPWVWNDRPGREKWEVVDALRHAAKLLRE